MAGAGGLTVAAGVVFEHDAGEVAAVAAAEGVCFGSAGAAFAVLTEQADSGMLAQHGGDRFAFNLFAAFAVAGEAFVNVVEAGARVDFGAGNARTGSDEGFKHGKFAQHGAALLRRGRGNRLGGSQGGAESGEQEGGFEEGFHGVQLFGLLETGYFNFFR